MKRVVKGTEPTYLTTFRDAIPHGTWEQLRDDPHYGGQNAYQHCRMQSIRDQNGLCAFCEIDIRDGNPLKSRVEHFHPKSDAANNHNWALDWNNMLGVCNGGSNPHLIADGFHLKPTEKNLSCDAHKDRMIQTGRLAQKCEGWIINPLMLAAFPSLFQIHKGTGHLLPDVAGCAALSNWPDKQHTSLESLVQFTIDMLNLNCDRLAQARLRVIWDIERNKRLQRQSGYTPQQGLTNLVHRYFRIQWPAFFTTIRLCLGNVAEEHLLEIHYQG